MLCKHSLRYMYKLVRNKPLVHSQWDQRYKPPHTQCLLGQQDPQGLLDSAESALCSCSLSLSCSSLKVTPPGAAQNQGVHYSDRHSDKKGTLKVTCKKHLATAFIRAVTLQKLNKIIMWNSTCYCGFCPFQYPHFCLPIYHVHVWNCASSLSCSCCCTVLQTLSKALAHMDQVQIP